MRYDAETSFGSMVDREKGTVARPIFADRQIYEMEIERIFARAWNFMCHESQIAKPGDFFLNYIGEESVIATRDKKGNLQVLLNTCRHRGNAVCRAEQGRATSFLCTYHGWTYDLEGRLVGVPGYKDFYHEALDREQWGLPKAAKVASYKGFVFANMDPEAPDLEDYLGPVGRLSLDLVAARGALVSVDGVQKSIIGCNWKFATDNVFDYYHGPIAHASASMVGILGGTRPGTAGGGGASPSPYDPNAHRVVLGEYGHAISGPRITEEAFAKLAERGEGPINTLTDDHWRTEARVREELGDMVGVKGHRLIFPNLWVVASTSQVCLRVPKGPDRTELWWFCLVPEAFDADERIAYVHMANHRFGASGLLEQEDGENWDQSTRAMRGPIAQRYPLNYQLDQNHGEVRRSERGMSYVDTRMNEHGAKWIYQAWADWMDAETWDALKRDHTPVPKEGEVV